MISIRKATERGHTNIGWLDSYHTFSFGDYRDPQHMGFGHLRVINEDDIAPAKGFDMHPHRDMEIVTYVTSGALRHEDSMGNSAIIKPGEIQRMTAGKGVLHSEYNASATMPVHLLQIWILPSEHRLPPSYEQITIKDRPDALALIASPNGREGSVTIHQNVDLYCGKFMSTPPIYFSMLEESSGWLQVISGSVRLNDLQLKPGDGAAVSGEREVTIVPVGVSELLWFHLY